VFIVPCWFLFRINNQWRICFVWKDENAFDVEINVPANRVSQLIHCKREITADTALRLGRYFGIEPEFWLNLQSRYNMKMAQRKADRKNAEE